MHRYSAASGGSGAGNNTTGGVPRDTARPDLSYSSSSNFSLTSRRIAQLTPYKLRCERESLSARLGPPDFYPPTPNCAEESLGREASQNGYKETIDGIEESRETFLTLTGTNSNSNSYWAKPHITRYKESIRKRLRALNNALVRKRKAGQVYGVPLSGPLLTKPGQFPEQRPCGEDYRKKWLEDLAQHKRLRLLADHVPHGLRKRTLFEALIKNEVPYLRATWFIKVMYLNQVRPLSIGISAGGPDKSQEKRVELWTKDVLEYTESVLNELCQHVVHTQLPHLGSSSQQSSDFIQGNAEGEEPSLQAKWGYMVQLMQLHYAEGLVHRVQVVEWVLKQLQERESIEALELLLPMVLDLVDTIVLSQTYVRVLVDISLNRLAQLCPSNSLPNASDQPQRLHITTIFIELLRYLFASVPDTFVSFDCFPLPPYVYFSGDGSSMSSASNLQEDGKTCAFLPSDCKAFSRRPLSHRELTIIDLAESVQKRAASLARAVKPGILHNNEGKVIQSLDKALSTGDVLGAYRSVFDEDFCSIEQLPYGWLAEVSSWLKFGSGLSGNRDLSEVYAVRFLCEWAICDFRDCRRGSLSGDRKVAVPRDMSRVYIAVSVLRLRMEELEKKKVPQGNNGGITDAVGGTFSPGTCVEVGSNKKRKGKNGAARDECKIRFPSFISETIFSGAKGASLSAFFQSPGPIHDIIVAWLDLHELRKGEGFENMQLLLLELVGKNLFWPPAYVRQLIVSGVLEKKTTAADVERGARHRCILQHLPGPPGLELDEEGKSGLNPVVTEAIRLYRNERHLALKACGLYCGKTEMFSQLGRQLSKESASNSLDAEQKISSGPYKIRDKGNKAQRKKLKVMQLKQAIATCLHLPDWCIGEQVKSVVSNISAGQGTLKRQNMVHGSVITDRADTTPGCEECFRSKKQKTTDGKSNFLQGLNVIPLDDDEVWWVKKMPMVVDTVKVELPPPPPPPPVPVKPAKQTVRGRPKAVRKLSLAQLAAARIEGSQGASSSHTCDSKVHCPHHKSAIEGGTMSQTKDSKKNSFGTDLRAIGTAMKGLRLGEKRLISGWLDETVHQLLDEGGKTASINTSIKNSVGAGNSLVEDEKNPTRWQLGEEELAAILYMLDVAMDFPSIVRLLLWLLPKAPIPTGPASGQCGRGVSIFAWNKDNFTVEVGEAALISSLRRYERVIAAMNLLPEVLSAGMQRVASIMAAVPAGRTACAPLLCFVRDLYKRYNGLANLQMWEKTWKISSDQRVVAELEALKAGESEPNFGLLGISNSGLGDDRDDLIPVRLVGRSARIGSTMKDLVQRGINEVIHQMVSSERELCLSSGCKDIGLERWDEGYQAAQRVVIGLLDCIKQNAGGAPQGDLQIVAAAVSAVVSNAGSAAAVVFDSFAASNSYASPTATGMASSLKCARQILQVHVHCLRLLKEAFGERQHRVLEVALACEATSLVANALGHSSGRTPRPQFQLSPETPDPGSALTGELTGSNALTLGRSTTVAAAIAALVLCVVLNGISGLERMIAVFKVKEGLESMHLSKNSCSNSNGISRAGGGNTFKGDILAETCLFWFRVLIGDCRSVAGGLVTDILGESSILAFGRMQRLMPLSTVFPAAYAVFTMAVRRQLPSFTNIPNREDVLVQQAICTAVNDLMAHEPFREGCLQDTRALYRHLIQDTSDCEYAALLDLQGVDIYSKIMSMVPLRARLFLHAILDCKLPTVPDDEAWMPPHGDLKGRGATGPIQMEQLVQVLDDLQPATFHWQWVELRLLLNEQVFMEKLDNMSAAEAVQAVTSSIDNGQLSESEKTFTEVVLTRLLVRPDAAALYSEAVHLLGRALEDYLILQVKWVLENSDMLLGRKSLRHQLEKIAHRRGFKVGTGRVKAWGWLPSQEVGNASTLNVHDRVKHEVASLEEGGVTAEGIEFRNECKERSGTTPGLYDAEFFLNKHFGTEKALADLVLPCLARSLNDTRTSFALELVKQMSNLEQQVSVTRIGAKPSLLTNTVAEGTNKALGSRKGGRGGLESGSPGIGRRFVASVADSLPASAPALQTSIWLRLQFLLPLLPLIHADRESTTRNMRQTLAPVLLRLLGTRVVQEAAEPFSYNQVDSLFRGRESEWNAEAAAAAAAAAAGEGLFDRLLSVLHALLSRSWAVWLKPKPTGVIKALREVPPFDREAAERMQAELEHMQLLQSVRVRLQAAIPMLPPTPTLTISAGPPQVPASALSVLQNSVLSASNSSTSVPLGISQKTPFRIENFVGKGKPPPFQEPEVEIDPWMLLEDGTGSSGIGGGSGATVSGENGNLKACPWLKGAVRVRRTDLTYVGAVDDDT